MNILFLVQPGTNSRRILLDMARGFHRAGHRTTTIELAPVWAALSAQPQRASEIKTQFTRELSRALLGHSIELCVAMWANALFSLVNLRTPAEGQTQARENTIFEALDIPHLLFWLDAPQWAHQDGVQPLFKKPILAERQLIHLINNTATAAEMTQLLGFGMTIAAPYAIDEEVFKPHDVPLQADVVYASGPGMPAPTDLALKLLESDEPDFGLLRAEAAATLRPRLLESLEHCSVEPPQREAFTDRAIDSQLHNRHTPVLQRVREIACEDASLARVAQWLLESPVAYTRFSMLLRQVEASERPFTAAFLSKRFNVETFGGGDLSAWGFQGFQHGMVDHERMAAIYSRAPIGLNLMRWQDDAGLNLKPIEIAASGCACVSVRRGGVEGVLTPTSEIELFDTPMQASRLIEALLSDDARRQSLASQGRSRVLREHTWAVRAQGLVEAVRARSLSARVSGTPEAMASEPVPA
ncbi:MAG: glycosyltransferase [Planctomycetota bacterium]|nr:glycosyltransferase [Planctomycetota bacterium]